MPERERRRGREEERRKGEKKKRFPFLLKGWHPAFPPGSAHSASGSTCHFLGVPGGEEKLAYMPVGRGQLIQARAGPLQGLRPGQSGPQGGEWDNGEKPLLPSTEVAHLSKTLAGVVSGWFPAAWRQRSTVCLLLSNRLAPNNLPRVHDLLGV